MVGIWGVSSGGEGAQCDPSPPLGITVTPGHVPAVGQTPRGGTDPGPGGDSLSLAQGPGKWEWAKPGVTKLNPGVTKPSPGLAKITPEMTKPSPGLSSPASVPLSPGSAAQLSLSPLCSSLLQDEQKLWGCPGVPWQGCDSSWPCPAPPGGQRGQQVPPLLSLPAASLWTLLLF